MAILLVLGGLLAGCGSNTGNDSKTKLREALAAVRPGEGRLSGAPWREPQTESLSSAPVIQEAAKAIEGEARSATAPAFHGYGVALFLAGQSNAAVEEINQAIRREPANPLFWNDLAAVRLQRGSDPYELVLALDAARQAVRLDPARSGPRFNLALALQRMTLQDRAESEWEEVHQTEADPQWAREAEERLDSLRRHRNSLPPPADSSRFSDALHRGGRKDLQFLAGTYPQSTREYLEETLLPSWAAAETERPRPEAGKELETARALAEFLVQAGGDPMPGTTFTQLEQARISDPRRYRALVVGLGTYAQALDLANRGDVSRAIPRFEEAERRLKDVGSPFALWASYRIAYCRYQSAAYEAARERLRSVLKALRPLPYGALRGRAMLMEGLIDGIEGRPAAALDAFSASESAFQKVREAPNATKAGANLATALGILGRYEDAWRRLHPALMAAASPQIKPEIRVSVAEYAAWLARREGRTEIAVWFLDDAFKSAGATKNPAAILGVLRQRAELLAALNQRTAALRDLEQARTVLSQIPDPRYRKTLEGDLLLAEAEFARDASPREVIAKLDQAIPIFRATSYHYLIGHALYLRAMAQKSLGQNDAAERDLTDAIAELERQRETISDPRDRISYLDRLGGLFDSMIGLQLDQRKQPEAALRFSEQAKARVLWDWILTSPSQQAVPADLRQAAAPLDLAALRASLPEGTAAVEYAALPGRLVVWVVHREGEVQYEPVNTSTAALEDLVQQFRHALLDHDSDGLKKISEQLYDLLIRPAVRHLRPGERLVLIPDGPLHALPFSLLRDRQSRHYLVQDHALAVSPSLRIYVTSRRRDALLMEGKRRALVVAAPDFDLKIDPSLSPLKSGDTDASIAKIFPGSQVIRGDGATREAFLKAAGDFEILHFGGHSVVNPESPLLSQMLFAKNPADPSRGVLYAGDVLRQKFPRTRLMVLASCGTASGRISRTEGVESLARPFLATGVPTVVASLWTVNDQPTADFFNLFYRKLAQRFDPVGALQAAQVELIERNQSPAAKPWTWGAFEVIGGGAPEESR